MATGLRTPLANYASNPELVLVLVLVLVLPLLATLLMLLALLVLVLLVQAVQHCPLLVCALW